MPLYEYRCLKCSQIAVELRAMRHRNDPFECKCGGKTERIISAPRMNVWNPEWKFPNLDSGPEKDHMCFDSETEYKLFLEENDIREIGGPRCTKNHNKTVFHYGKPEQPKPTPGTW